MQHMQASNYCSQSIPNSLEREGQEEFEAASSYAVVEGKETLPCHQMESATANED